MLRLVWFARIALTWNLFDGFLKLTIVSPLIEMIDFNEKCFKLYNHVNN